MVDLCTRRDLLSTSGVLVVVSSVHVVAWGVVAGGRTGWVCGVSFSSVAWRDKGCETLIVGRNKQGGLSCEHVIKRGHCGAPVPETKCNNDRGRRSFSV